MKNVGLIVFTGRKQHLSLIHISRKGHGDVDRRGSPLHPQRTVRRDVSANHLAGRAGGGDPGGASLRGDPAAASCQALPPSSAEAYRQESVKGYGGFTITPPDGRCIKKVEAIKLDLIQ